MRKEKTWDRGLLTLDLLGVAACRWCLQNLSLLPLFLCLTVSSWRAKVLKRRWSRTKLAGPASRYL